MSQENVEIVRRMWDAFLAADFQTALSFFVARCGMGRDQPSGWADWYGPPGDSRSRRTMG